MMRRQSTWDVWRVCLPSAAIAALLAVSAVGRPAPGGRGGVGPRLKDTLAIAQILDDGDTGSGGTLNMTGGANSISSGKCFSTPQARQTAGQTVIPAANRLLGL